MNYIIEYSQSLNTSTIYLTWTDYFALSANLPILLINLEVFRKSACFPEIECVSLCVHICVYLIQYLLSIFQKKIKSFHLSFDFIKSKPLAASSFF